MLHCFAARWFADFGTQLSEKAFVHAARSGRAVRLTVKLPWVCDQRCQGRSLTLRIEVASAVNISLRFMGFLDIA